ncbi:MAG: hypothetical protein DHS20C01_06430 [marine bacterium B5-7]|nr:MAG: hypothetical protein DHS20C01_06430 [marine bacterium B5-7]
MFNLVLILVGSAVLGASLYETWRLHITDQPSAQPATVASTVQLPVQSPQHYQLRKIQNARLFGEPPKVKQPVVPAVVPKTRLSLKLHGMVGSETPYLARALISIGNRPPRSYGIGEEVADTDAIIHQVEQDRVLLDRAGQIESLELDRIKLKTIN